MLNDFTIKNLKPAEKVYRRADHDGLCIEVKPSGVKLWRFRYRYLGKASMLGLGEYPALGLKEARQLKDEMVALLKRNIDPAQQRKDEKNNPVEAREKNLFKDIAKEYKEKRLAHRSADYVEQFQRSLDKDILKVIGGKDVRSVTSADILLIMENTIKRVKKQKNFGTGEVTAIQNRKNIGAVMRYAIATLRAENDPTYAVRDAIERPEVEHARPLEKAETRVLRSRLESYGGSFTVKHAGLMMLYTMIRTIELRRLKWEYIDFEDRLIIFPATSKRTAPKKATKKKTTRVMKRNRIHIVPMSNQVFNLLMDQQKISGMREYVFPGVYSGSNMLSASTINRMLEYIGLDDVTAHDFRATASTLLNEKGYEKDWIEKQLSHDDEDKTRASYNHARYLADRSKMLQDWADIIDSWKSNE